MTMPEANEPGELDGGAAQVDDRERRVIAAILRNEANTRSMGSRNDAS